MSLKEGVYYIIFLIFLEFVSKQHALLLKFIYHGTYVVKCLHILYRNRCLENEFSNKLFVYVCFS